MSNLRFVEKLANAPWLCEPEHVEFLHGIFLRYLERAEAGQPLDPKAIEQATGRPLENTRKVTIRDGVARIPVEGTIVRRASLFTQISGGVSTEALTKDFITAYNDATVHSILFAFDSPGGEAHGINELAGIIREKRDLEEKRIEAYCDGTCASAAYWLASATSKITTDAMGSLGSIGVVSRVRNPDALSKRDTLEFWNSRSPRKRLDYQSYEGQEAIQEYVNSLGDEFIRAVADNRGVSTEKVERDFGQGFVLVGRKAVEVGLADELGSEEGVIASLQARERGPLRINTAALAKFANRSEEDLVSEQTTEQAPETIGEDVVTAEWAASDERPESIVARALKILGMSPAAATSAEDSTDETTDDEQIDRQGEEADSGMSETGTEEAVRDTGKQDRGASLTSEERIELERLRAEVETERTERAKTAAALRERGIERMLDAKGTVDLGDGKRGAMPKAQRDAATTLIASLETAGADVIELSASGEATLKDNEAGKAVNALLTHWKPQEIGERGTQESAGESGGAQGDHERIMATLADRNLGAEHYETVAGELAAKGEIRREG